MLILYLVILFIACSLLALVVWNALAWPGVGARSEAPAGLVSVLIPARDEERNLAACISSVLRQGEIVLEVLVYDDHSLDATASIARGYAKRDGRVRVLAGEELPGGWCGKSYACSRLALEARGRWLLFLDADARLADDSSVARMSSEATRRGVTLLSCWPAQTALSFWEKMLMPMLNFVVLTLFPAPLSLVRMDESLGLAHGACLLLERESYERVGGHALVRGEIFEDTRLAQLWRARGERGVCLDGSGVVRVRMYGSLQEIWRGFQKNFFPAFRRETFFWSFIALHLTVFLLPFILLPFALRGAGAGRLLLLLIISCVLSMRALLTARFGGAWWSALLHPLSEVVLIALGLSSWYRCRSGRGVAWKGRRYRTGKESGLSTDG